VLSGAALPRCLPAQAERSARERLVCCAMALRAAALAAWLLAPCVSLACDFGTAPGGWRALEHGVVHGRGSPQDEYYRLDASARSLWLQTSAENPAVPFGENWYTYDASCPLQNRLAGYWPRAQAAAGAPHAAPLPPNRTIVLLGDSIDAHFLDYACAEYARRNGTGWHAFVHSHRLANYCLLPSGLRLVQMYLMRHNSADDARRIDTVRRLFAGEDDVHDFDGKSGDRATLDLRSAEVAPLAGAAPHLVVVSSAYWPLQHFAGAFGEELTPDVLPPDFVARFVESTRAVVAAARAAFPPERGTLLALHTSAGIRTDCSYGTNVDRSNKRIWGKKSYVAQLNAALRFVAAAERVPLIDFELIASALTPAQFTADDVHPRSFFSLEVLNIYLNMLDVHARGGIATR
jgi:hypothetical protein